MAAPKLWMRSRTASAQRGASISRLRRERRRWPMPDLSVNFCGVRSPNPFWLASGPPTNTGYQVMKAFDAGWGGAVWKTIGEPIINTASRYGSIDYKNERMIGLNNIELISDRPIETNFREIAEVKKRFPQNTVVASLMVESKRETGTRLFAGRSTRAPICWS